MELNNSKKIAIELLPYQKEAVKFAINVPYHGIYIQTGRGKSLVSVFYARVLLKKNLADKIILCSSKTGSVSMHKAFGKAGISLNQYDDLESALEFFKSDEKICVWKHSMIEKIGNDQYCLDFIRNSLEGNYKKIAIVIDEAHKLSSSTGILHNAFMNLRFAFERISLQTATPYGSTLLQLYGLIHLIYPKLWKSERAFKNDHIEERVVFDKVRKRVHKKETIAYKNLDILREKILPFSFFYYPPLDLTYIEHRTRLKDYTDYNDLCYGLLTKKDLEEKQ